MRMFNSLQIPKEEYHKNDWIIILYDTIIIHDVTNFQIWKEFLIVF